MSALNARRQFGDFFPFALSHYVWNQFHHSISSMRRHQIIWFLWKWFLFPMFDVFFFVLRLLRSWNIEIVWMEAVHLSTISIEPWMNVCIFNLLLWLIFLVAICLLHLCGSFVEMPRACALCSIKVQHIRKTSKTSVQKWRRCYKKIGQRWKCIVSKSIVHTQLIPKKN